MSDETQADEVAVGLCRAYQALEIAAFVVRTNGLDSVRMIGLQLPPEAVARMLRSAADEYERAVGPVVMN